FEEIMELPEYYLSNAEFDVLRRHEAVFSDLVRDEPFHLIELGAGNGAKAGILIDYYLKSQLKFDYVPIDTSDGAMETLTTSLHGKFPDIKLHGLVAEYFDALKWLSQLEGQRNVVLFLGSNLGNFNKSQARTFLRNLWNALNNGDILVIGFDLKKDIDLMMSAYNDSRGVTAKFNLNLLNRINNDLGGNFNLSQFRHYASYDVFSGAMESYLVSMAHQEVFIKEIGQSFFFEPWEPIQTEYSYKYLESDILELADATGFVIVNQLYDSRKYFTDSIWKVQKQKSLVG
ncbi:MAG: L-histidine N(alpha)-methyltransferase, partial [bacterium]|nr:L-histidine N(alpha)-methyltransferase [bacterium]